MPTCGGSFPPRQRPSIRIGRLDPVPEDIGEVAGAVAAMDGGFGGVVRVGVVVVRADDSVDGGGRGEGRLRQSITTRVLEPGLANWERLQDGRRPSGIEPLR